MCGIIGKISLNSGTIAAGDLKKMAFEIDHRGPDDEGIFISSDHKVGLGNRRLAIIDLSASGHQPMSYKNRYWITYNGEIYNFKALRKKLVSQGYKFNSQTDTEVILALYDRYKTSCLAYLRGMFAFAIYDLKENTLFLARDRIGKKPLKYYYDGNQFIFASELKSIFQLKDIKKYPDYHAIHLYLVYGYIPSPLTGFENIKKLEPGKYLFLDIKRKKLIKKSYWQPSFRNKLILSENEWCNKILDTLEEATELRMVSDVPLGALLSGGTDSSAVVAAMAKLSDQPINTFTVVFKDKRWNESQYAQNIVKRYQTNHQELLVKPENIENLPQMAYFYEEPFADAGYVISYMVSKLARKYVTVVLNGDGGDENFAGYPNRYFRLKRDVDFYKWLNDVRPTAVLGLRSLNKIISNKLLTRSVKFFEKSKLPLYERFASYNQIFSASEIAEFANSKLHTEALENNPYEIVDKCFSSFRGRNLKDAGLKFDLLYWLPDDLLAKADIASMANSLEARSPLLDQEMIELACKIPFNLKVKNKEPKYIFKKALEKIVPKENLYRPKRGFGLPLHIWFTGKLNSYSEDLLLNKRSFVTELIKKDVIKDMLDFHGPETDYGPKLWSLLTLELWFRNYFA